MRIFGLLAPIAASAILLGIASAVSIIVTAAPLQGNRAGSSETPSISFTVSMSKPSTHLLEVEMRVRQNRFAKQTNLVMPVWTPGSYLVREYARHVQDFTVTDDKGQTLPWSKTNKNTWRIEAAADMRELRATYRVYANELTVRTNELNDTHAFWNNAALLMFVENQLSAPATVRVVPFGNWQIATGLPAVPNEPNTFAAANFDVLYDSPFEVGRFRTLEFNVRNVPHRIVIDGEGNYDAERMRTDVAKIVEAATSIFGELPYTDYTFILHLRASGGGGLEHLNSTALIFQRYGFKPATSYRNFLSLAAHEFFHLYNVKRIRPDALGPFNYTEENYTRLLWVAEGLTSYYDELLLRRAGLTTDKEYLESLAALIQKVQNSPGRQSQSAEEASFDAWIKYYRPDENSINTSISYYDKGALLGMLLDLEIRQRTNGAKTLDDVMRRLYTEFYKRNRGYTSEDFETAVEHETNSNLDRFFAAYIRGREELNYNAALSGVGLRLDTTGNAKDAKTVAGKAYLGATLAQEGERLVVKNVPASTPAYDQGLSAGDHIVAVNDQRATLEFVNARIDERQPGDVLRLTVFRQDDLRVFEVKLGRREQGDYQIVPIENPKPEQAKLYQGWLNAVLSENKKEAP